MNASYALPVQNTVLDHDVVSEDMPTWLGDYAESRAKKDRAEHAGKKQQFTTDDALAASGDYFITLATALDKIAQSLPHDGAEQIQIESLVSTLFYLQKHYVIIAKHKLR
jgi:hypothetical protein